MLSDGSNVNPAGRLGSREESHLKTRSGIHPAGRFGSIEEGQLIAHRAEWRALSKRR
jgi:hypothetical protein